MLVITVLSITRTPLLSLIDLILSLQSDVIIDIGKYALRSSLRSINYFNFPIIKRVSLYNERTKT
ncbi:hypothetical protein BpHYR1_021579 [Brachionus plicatilis]|uniref:Uncharacterized protein n=1 Tax=Brachionus plicatilis TaxID=10195 RepID=A0A3M7S752_BRAPC|nr:hypothetical protein BpHYR1_021579 [Brachionus plicatilis]